MTFAITDDLLPDVLTLRLQTRYPPEPLSDHVILKVNTVVSNYPRREGGYGFADNLPYRGRIYGVNF